MSIDSVQRYLDEIYPVASTQEGIAARLGLLQSDVAASLAWLIAQRRAVSVDGAVLQYQSTKAVRSVSRGFSGTMD